MKLALFAAVALVAPFLLLRSRARRRYFEIAIGQWAVFWFLGLAAHALKIAVDPFVAIVTCAVLNTALFWFLVSASADVDVQWSAPRAALVAALFYVAAIPPMMVHPPDGDEPYFILMTESIARDHDLDLGNQYRDLPHSAVGRTDVRPQLGDPVGAHGELYSRHEPFLALLLLPGYLVAKLPGVLVTMAIFGALLARSTIRMLEEEGIDDPTIRRVFPFFALGPPCVYYAVRVWPEVPAAFCLVEAIRGIRARRARRWVPSMLALVLIKLRFLLVAVVLLARTVRRPRHIAVAAVIVALPLLIVWVVSGSAMNVHAVGELIPGDPKAMPIGLFGLLLDGAQGLTFQAPFYLFGIVALTRWRSMPAAFRIGMSAAALYILYLVPRVEWHGGWSPPLRYITAFMPLLALGAAALWQRFDFGPIALAAAWTIALVAHAMAFPWRLFHIENGENATGEMLSSIWHSDFSRLFPSFIRLNVAAYVAAIMLIVALALFRSGRWASPIVAAALLLAAFVAGRRPADRIEFEDAHVIHRGGQLYPYVYQVQRFLYRGGWIMHPGDSLSFLVHGGRSILQYQAAAAATVQIGSRAYALPATGPAYGSAAVDIEHDGRVELRCLSGAVNVDRMDRQP